MDAQLWDERYSRAELVWGAEPNRFVRELCERLPVGRAIDLACGEGRNAIWLAKLGWQVVGVDFSAAAIERARELSGQLSPNEQLRVTWRVADVTREPPRPSSVDLVVVSYVHLQSGENQTLLATAARAVRPDGHVVVVGHDRRNLDEGVGGPQDPDRLYVAADVVTPLIDAGLQVDIAETVPRPTDAGTALDTVVRARRPADT